MASVRQSPVSRRSPPTELSYNDPPAVVTIGRSLRRFRRGVPLAPARHIASDVHPTLHGSRRANSVLVDTLPTAGGAVRYQRASPVAHVYLYRRD